MTAPGSSSSPSTRSSSFRPCPIHNAPLLRAADRLLFMPDLLTYFLSGAAVNEATISSTSQLIDPRTRDWAGDLLAEIGLAPTLVRRPIEPGNLIGSLLPALARETGLRRIPVAATAGHDTAAAVAAVPAPGGRWAYISSGTWSLIGVETRAPLITPRTRTLNFTNEGGVGGTVRFLKNVTGLWLVQRCRRLWNAESPVGYDDLKRLAEQAPPFRAFVDPDAPEFLNPERHARGHPRLLPPHRPEAAPKGRARSSAASWRAWRSSTGPSWTTSPRSSPSRSKPSTSSAAAARTGSSTASRPTPPAAPWWPVPSEATAIGNILGQALALGRVGSLEEARRIVAASFRLEAYEPHPSPAWDEAFGRFLRIAESARTGDTP